MAAESTTYRPLAFYGFSPISEDEVETVRLSLKELWQSLGALGRVYVNKTGVNGQMIVPESNLDDFSERTLSSLESFYKASREKFILNVEPRTIEVAPEELTLKKPKWQRGPLPFSKLDVRHREELVSSAGVCNDVDLGLTFGHRLAPEQWHEQIAKLEEDSILIDVRNDYEWMIGHFQGATLPPVATFRDTFPYLDRLIDERGENLKSVYM